MENPNLDFLVYSILSLSNSNAANPEPYKKFLLKKIEVFLKVFYYRASTKGMKNQKALQSSANFGHFSDTINSGFDDFFANSVMTACVIVGRILLSVD